MVECVFCKIANKEIPCALLGESERVMSFLDISPVNYGHALVIPKKHVEHLLDADHELVAECMAILQKVAKACVEVTGAEGFNLLQNNGECSGQVVPHLHFHVIPRRSDDGFSLGWRHESYEQGEMERLCDEIAKRIGG